MGIKAILQTRVSGGSEQDDRFLHELTRTVIEINDNIREIIQDLKDTLWEYPFCRGLSAPQIGYPYAISIVNAERQTPDQGLVIINPKVIRMFGKKDKKRESCMSVWGKIGEVERRDKIEVQYQNEKLETVHATFSGFQSRLIQHEIDHLNGILYCDILVPNSELTNADFYSKYSTSEGGI